MRNLIMGAALALATAPMAASASEEIARVKASGDVMAVTDALEAAVTGAGATVFARVDHGAGALNIGEELAPAQLLIFGNPKLGTPALQDNIMAGLFLPLRVLVYRDGDGQVWLAYEDPGEMLSELDGISEDAPYVAKMRGALGKLTAKAAGGG